MNGMMICFQATNLHDPDVPGFAQFLDIILAPLCVEHRQTIAFPLCPDQVPNPHALPSPNPCQLPLCTLYGPVAHHSNAPRPLWPQMQQGLSHIHMHYDQFMEMGGVIWIKMDRRQA